jgi:hypothetical protein
MISALLRPRTVSRESRWGGVVGGLGYVLVLLLSLTWAYGLVNVLDALVSIQIGPWLWWAFLGGAILGGLLGMSYTTYNLVSPLLTVVVVYGVAMYQMWLALRSPYPLLPGTPLDIYLISWPLLLLLAVGSGFVEHRLRDRPSDSRKKEAP